jgi:hypothetical protein
MRQGIKIIGALGLVMVVIAGCNSTEQTLAPIPADTPITAQESGAAGLLDANAGLGAETAQPASASTPSAAALPAGQIRGRIRFMPVIGAPVNAVTPLSRQLATEARNRGLAILSASEAGGDHVLKGYFSAESFEGQTTVFYVWDVLDPTGARLHRIQGQEVFPGGSGDPWASVPANVMERIATRSIGEYTAWRGL